MGFWFLSLDLKEKVCIYDMVAYRWDPGLNATFFLTSALQFIYILSPWWSSFFFKLIFFMCECLPAWRMCTMAFLIPTEGREDTGSPGTPVTHVVSLWVCWEKKKNKLKPSPSKNQKGVLIIEPSLFSLNRIILVKIVSVVPKIREHVIYVIFH